MKYELTQDELKRSLDYNEDTGIFTWKFRSEMSRSWNTRWCAKKAGSLDRYGYLRITINWKRFSAHRLAWLLATGSWPENELDHIDGDKTNNRVQNLRDVTRPGNQHNQRAPMITNTSGYLGVSFDKRSGKFRASIKIDRKQRGLGYFSTAEDASQAYLAAKRKIHVTCTI